MKFHNYIYKDIAKYIEDIVQNECIGKVNKLMT